MRNHRMLTENEVGEILSRHSRGEGKRRIAKAMGISVTTVVRYLRMPDAQVNQARSHQHMIRECQLDSVKDYIEEKFWEVEGNCRNLQEQLSSERNMQVNLRTLEWYCQNKLDVRRQFDLAHSSRAGHPYRIETEPGQEVQIDFGEKKVVVGEELRKIHFFTATLGFSRRIYAAFFFCENQETWLCGLERSFRYFKGIPRNVICDNAKALVYKPRRHGTPPVYTDGFRALCRYWGIHPIACNPEKPQHKGKVERTVSYLKDSFLKDFRHFKSLEDVQQKFEIWEQTIASSREMETADAQPIHFTPKSRFIREAAALIPCVKPSISEFKTSTRKVDEAGHISVDGRRYKIPTELSGKTVSVLIGTTKVIVSFQGKTVVRLDKDVDACKPIKRILLDEQVKVQSLGEELPPSPVGRSLEWYANLVANCEAANAHRGSLQ